MATIKYKNYSSFEKRMANLGVNKGKKIEKKKGGDRMRKSKSNFIQGHIEKWTLVAREERKNFIFVFFSLGGGEGLSKIDNLGDRFFAK